MQATNRYKVLVAEDDRPIALAIEMCLRSIGHQVVDLVESTDQAVERAADADLVLMNIHLRGARDGMTAAREVRTRHQVPLVFLTEDLEIATNSNDPFEYLIKPVDQVSLQLSIEIAVYKHRLKVLLEAEECWCRAALASMTEGVVVTDTSGRICIMNRAAEVLSGWASENAIGQPLESVIHLVEEESSSEVGDLVPLAILCDESTPLKDGLRLISRDGRALAIEGAVAPVRSHSKVLMGATLALRDVTQRRWAERRLRQERRVEVSGMLAARISAEYAILVETIRTRTGLLTRQLDGNSAARSALEDIRAAVLAAQQVTEKLAVLGVRQVAQRHVLKLNDVLRQIFKPIQRAADGRLVVAINPGPGIGLIKIVPKQVKQAIMNIVLHACAISPEGGRLLIETSRTEVPQDGKLASFVACRLTYDATEIDLDQLFDPAGNAVDGMALSVAHFIVAEHGGYLMANATPDGTLIDLLLPRVNEQLELSSSAVRAGHAPTILLLDGREWIRARLHNFFEAAGYNLLEASDHKEALELGSVHEGRIDMLIADGIEGGPILSELRVKHPHLEALTVVDMPELSLNEIRRPFSQRDLLARVAKVLERAESTTNATRRRALQPDRNLDAGT